jgi:hypothetical protein
MVLKGLDICLKPVRDLRDRGLSPSQRGDIVPNASGSAAGASGVGRGTPNLVRGAVIRAESNLQ